MGFSLGSTFLINAEVDSMGGTVDGGGCIDTKPSPRRAAIEKAQSELRLEYDVREERRRELEFLEKGGDPLEFKVGHAASVSVQSTSHTDRHPDQNFTSEAKCSFALTASPYEDSVESSGRLGVPITCEPNSADNFDGENEKLQSDRKSTCPGRCSIAPPEHSSQRDRHDQCCNVKDSEDSPIFHPKKDQSYKRRNQSRANGDGPPSNSADMASPSGHDSSTTARLVMLSKPVASENQFVMKDKLEEMENMSSKADGDPVSVRMAEPDNIIGMDSIDTVDVKCPPSSCIEKIEGYATSAQLNETNMINGDNKCNPADALIKNAPVMIKGLDSGSSFAETNASVDENENIDSDFCINLKNVDSYEAPKVLALAVEDNSVSRDDKLSKEEHATNAMETASCIEGKSSNSRQGNGFTEDNADVYKGDSALLDEVNGPPNAEGQENHNDAEIKLETELSQLDDCVSKLERSCPIGPIVDQPFSEVNRNAFSGSIPVIESQPSMENQPTPLSKEQEDRILEEARMIEAKRKRIAELSIGLLEREHSPPKCHWDLVLEEMTWLANDFAQERLWKMTAAAQTCHRMAFASRIRLEEQSKVSKQKSVAHTLSKAVMEFWHSARLTVENTDSSLHEKCKHEALLGIHELDKPSQDVLRSTRRKQDLAVNGYAVRFLQFNCSPKPFVAVEVPGVMEVPFDADLPELSWFTEENLFYAVPPGALEVYRKSVESHLAECERIGNKIHEEVDTSGHGVAEECGYGNNDHEEDEGENLYYLPGAIRKSLKKKRKIMKSHIDRSYELGGDFVNGQCLETRNDTPQLNLMGKSPTNSLHVDPIPTKRMRTASRQRVVGPFSASPSDFAPVLNRVNFSSGDTNSFQDDQSSLRGGSVVPKGSEVDSSMNFEKQSAFDSAEMSAKPKKKKKIKHQIMSYDQRWQLDPSMQNEQKDLVRKRLDNHHLESNGNGGLLSQHKKPKLAKHSLDTSFDNTVSMNGSVASPVASQMSNMSSQNKIIKFIGGRDRGKKGKGLKVSTGQLGSGSPWTIVEDQALVVLVHDMGPNWELVSDAINNILQFKCIFRKPHECKERHKYLMDRPSGDGADSAEDSESSQPYPSTLPGIPKGSARQLFRSLHAHVEEDNIKSRFEKIICIVKQLHFHRRKNDDPNLKPITPIHGSHVLSLSQVIPNNVNGGVLTPLDLCDTATSNQDPVSIGYRSPHAGVLPMPIQSNIPPMHYPGGLNSPVQGSPSMSIGNNLASPPSQLTSPRDERYSIPRSGSLPIEEHQRLHQYNTMPPGRNVQASSLSCSGSLGDSERGVRMMPGMHRRIPMARPGVPSLSMLNSGSMLASNLVGMPSNMNVHSGTASAHGTTIYRPRDTLHGVQGLEHQRQIILPETQMQTTQTNLTASSPRPTYPTHHQQQPTVHPHLSTINHGATPDQLACLHLARDPQLKHRLMQRQQQQLKQHPSSAAIMPSSLQSNSQLQSSSSSSPTLSYPATHVGPQPHQQQKHLPGHIQSTQSGLGRMVNAGDKPRQQTGRQHPLQRQQSQTQQVELMKGSRRGNNLMHQNPPGDPSHVNGLSSNPASPISEEGDQALHLPYSGSSQNILPSPSLVPPQKPYVNRGPATTKPVQQISSRNHQQLQGQPAAKRRNQQNHQVSSESLNKSKVDYSQAKQVSLSVGTPACVTSARGVAVSSSVSDVVRMAPDPVCDSAMTSVSSPLGPSISEAVTNFVGNKLVSHGHESKWQQIESHLQPSPLKPMLPQKRSQQLELPSQRPPHSQSQSQIQGGDH